MSWNSRGGILLPAWLGAKRSNAAAAYRSIIFASADAWSASLIEAVSWRFSTRRIWQTLVTQVLHGSASWDRAGRFLDALYGKRLNGPTVVHYKGEVTNLLSGSGWAN